MTALDAPAVLRAIPDHLDKHGWCQGADHNNEGAACLRGAINDLAPEGPVRAEVHLRFQLHTGRPVIGWNDSKGRTLDEVKVAVVAAADANLRAADLGYADLRAADLGYADLRAADLGYADLRGANLGGAKYNQSTVWPDGFSPADRGAVLA